MVARAHTLLRHQPVVLDGPAARAAAVGIRSQVDRHDYHLYALALMPDHVHVVFKRHATSYEQVIRGLKAVPGRSVRSHGGVDTGQGSTDFNERRRITKPVWSRGYWIRYLNTSVVITAAIDYVQRNPVRLGLPAQRWSFVTSPPSLPV